MKDEKKVDFGNRLRQIRNSHNLTRPEFAKSLEVGSTSLHHYENGERLPDVGFLIKLKDLYHVDIGWLIFGQKETDLPNWQANYTADDLRLIDYLKNLNPKAKQALLAFLDNLAK
ncbi:helix-turn-helix domain-containing protein [Moraxella bovis]|uniref:helix-turn-helix domain-containing protein n=1 Tax=Moraxella bovis TaxID=476 RepID=UPI0022273241|nr:helix-turn-helix transcriptional regulator [Moraxella bovis]UZA24934.1 helix-turn-helix domain-containing protein [Moraxella bovis]UZA29578.1 helix-turn-helix domain-containing protein [Moraxella bovis]